MNITKLFKSLADLYPFWFATVEPVFNGKSLFEDINATNGLPNREVIAISVKLQFVLVSDQQRARFTVLRRISSQITEEIPEDSHRVALQVLGSEMAHLEELYFETLPDDNNLRMMHGRVKLKRLAAQPPRIQMFSQGCKCFYRHAGTNPENTLVTDDCPIHRASSK